MPQLINLNLKVKNVNQKIQLNIYNYSVVISGQVFTKKSILLHTGKI